MNIFLINLSHICSSLCMCLKFEDDFKYFSIIFYELIIGWRKSMKKTFILMIALFSVLLNIPVFADGNNIVQNFGFEKGSLDKWHTQAYTTTDGVTEFFIDDTVSHSGSNSACIVNNSPNHSRFNQEIKVKGNSYYKLSCWVKTENVGSDFSGANITVEGIMDISDSIKDTSDWQYIELYGSTKKNQKSIILSLALGSYGNENTGKVWFDDVVVEKVNQIPTNVRMAKLYFEDNIPSPEEVDLPEEKNIFFMTPYTIIFFIVAIILIVLAKKEIIKLKSRSEKILLIVSLVIGLLVRLIFAARIEGFSVDIGCFRAWSMTASSINGIRTFYTSGMFCDYPPFYILILAIVGAISNLFNFTSTLATHLIMIKLPAIIADVVTAFLFYKLSRKKFNGTLSLVLSVLYIFNPATFLNSTLWGQVDSFFTMILLIGTLLIYEGKLTYATIFFTISVLMKPQGIIFLPVIGYELIIDFIKTKKIKNIAYSALYAAITTVIVILPFSIGQAPTWLIDLYINTAEGYQYASMNAYNLFSLFGANAKSDDATLFIFSYYVWGMLFIVITSLFTGFLYLVNFIKNKQEPKFIAPIGMLIQMTGVFVLSTRMHERYLFPSMALALLCYIFYKNVSYLVLFGGISATVFVNTYDVLVRMFLTDSPYIPADDKILFIGSLANVVLLLLLCVVSVQTVVKRKTTPLDLK